MSWQWVDGVQHLEVGYHVLPRFQGLGLATEAARSCRDLARTQGMERLIAIIHRDNRASRRVAEKVGLVMEQETVSAFGQPTLIYATSL